LIYKPQFKNDLATLELTEYDIADLVQSEFRSHLNYFRFDLEDYPMPVKSHFIVYLSKIENDITFLRAIPCTKNEAKLASWNDILTLYRRATRLAYRQVNADHKLLLYTQGAIGRATTLHLEIQSRIEKHFAKYDALVLQPMSLEKLEVPSTDKDNKSIAVSSISFHLHESYVANKEVTNIIEYMDADDITPDDAIGLIVSQLERSLQHIHKIIIDFPPL
jgi:hypothetical protein